MKNKIVGSFESILCRKGLAVFYMGSYSVSDVPVLVVLPWLASTFTTSSNVLGMPASTTRRVYCNAPVTPVIVQK